MTRRLSITILLTVWAAILLAGVSAWWTTRAVLVADLDQTIQRRAMMVPEVAGRGGRPPAFEGDQYVVYDERMHSIHPPPGPAAVAPPLVVKAEFTTLPEGRIRSLTLRFPGAAADAPTTIIYRASAARLDSVLRRLAIALTLFGMLAGAVAALIAARLARLALRPLRRTADTIGSIDESNLGRRIDAAALPPELKPMAGRLNEMLERVERAFEQRRRFLADASHELRTPVAAMITTMEVALRRPRSGAELAGTIQVCLDESRHLRGLVEALMRQVRAERIAPDGPAQGLDASQLLRQCADLTESLAAGRNVRLVRRLNGAIRVRADEGRLRSVILNLVGNAIEYNRAGGCVELGARTDGGFVEITIRDDGPGIAAEQLSSVFEPFFRGEAHPNSDGHLGLGLFLVDSHVKAMGGQCRVDSTPGAGTTFCVRLPAEGVANPPGEVT